MGDAETPTQKKESVRASVVCPMLNSTNYTVWSLRMKVTLRVHKVWEAIEPGTSEAEKNDGATALLFQSIPESLILQVGDRDSPKEIWEAIKSRHLGADRVREARLQTLMSDFERLKMKDSETIDIFAGKISELASKSASLGQILEEPKLVKKFLNSLPRNKYIHIIASLEQVLDLNKTGFEDIVGRLKAYEERILDDVSHGETQGELLFTKRDSRGESSRGRGRGRGKSNTQDRSKEKKERPDVICFRCDKTGHFASVCPERIQKLRELNKDETQEEEEEEEEEALYMHEIVFLNEEKLIPKNFEAEKEGDGIWYLDNGASNHMTGVRSFFSELNEEIKGKVKFGDGSCVDISGKGSILFEGKTGEQRLMTDIYYIPELKSNIISLGQATEYGCDVRMKGEHLKLRDPAGRLLVKVSRSPNRLYKIHLKVGKPACLQLRIEEDNWRWHARLGHISFKTMESMSNLELVHGLPKINGESKICESCLVGKQARQAFPKATQFRSSSPLELLHADLCGPITPATPARNRYIFVIIDDHTRYMWSILLKEKSDAFEKFKTFKNEVEKDLGKMILTFTSSEFQEFCNKTGIEIKQEAYARRILKEAGLDTCNPTHIPMEFGLKLSKGQEGDHEIDATMYRRKIGCLRYLLHSRPDLAFSVGILSRYMQDPRESHGNALKQILRYLQGTTAYGVSFRRGGTQKLVGYSDSSHNTDPDDGRSTTGHVFYLGESPITWCSQKQETVALSSCEAEFMAATEAAKQAIWLQDLLSEITGQECKKTTIWIDNKSAIALTKNPVFHRRSKHIHKRFHFIRECVENEQLEVEHVPGEEQCADILTKALARIKFKKMRGLIGVQDLSKTSLKLKGVNVG